MTEITIDRRRSLQNSTAVIINRCNHQATAGVSWAGHLFEVDQKDRWRRQKTAIIEIFWKVTSPGKQRCPRKPQRTVLSPPTDNHTNHWYGRSALNLNRGETRCVGRDLRLSWCRCSKVELWTLWSLDTRSELPAIITLIHLRLLQLLHRRGRNCAKWINQPWP